MLQGLPELLIDINNTFLYRTVSWFVVGRNSKFIDCFLRDADRKGVCYVIFRFIRFDGFVKIKEDKPEIVHHTQGVIYLTDYFIVSKADVYRYFGYRNKVVDGGGALDDDNRSRLSLVFAASA